MVERGYFARGAQVFPQPVAVGCGRVARARSPQEELDAALRCGEILTRYAAAVAICSLAHREAEPLVDCAALREFQGPLAFGKFLSALQWAVPVEAAHPASEILSRVRARDGGRWDKPLVQLLELRNELGHDLVALSEPHAVAVSREKLPLEKLAAALEAIGPVLDLPLFVVESQQLERRKLRVRRLLLMGESLEPTPEELEVEGGVGETRVPYVAMGATVVPLKPLLVWDVARSVASYALFLIDKVETASLQFQALGKDARLSAGSEGPIAARMFAGERLASADTCTLPGGRDLREEWLRRRRDVEERLADYAQPIDWSAFDTPTVNWYAKRLDPSSPEGEAKAVIISRLLDDREALPVLELRQLQLLLGTPQTMRSIVGRAVLDCRVRRAGGGRWDERLEIEHNVLQALRAAIDFFGRHIGVAGASIDRLTAVAGSADYIAMREALVNLFIHQDYSVRNAAAQLEIKPDRAVFFNPGRSLVSEKALAEGGRSYCRNPLIARALRLIGFAELAGSGLREVQRAWRGAMRRPPMFESNTPANTFTLTLDWRPLVQEADTFWLETFGARVSPAEAQILSICSEPPGLSVAEIAASTEASLEDVEGAVQRLQVNALLEKKQGRFVLPERLRGRLAERARRAPGE